MRVLLCALGLFAAIPLTLRADDQPNTILVLDASGSMWGQIDGEAKITIAQRVVGTLLDTLPSEQALGLVAYGHNRRGDCTDIETLVAPGSGTRDAIMGAVNGINPKGKTPLSAAVITAAEALRATEEAATVILVSDGRETCDLDPCAVGRQLEETGVDFTAHVIGFDITDDDARAELQCLAEATGGSFHTAASADELATAISATVVAEPEPAPAPISVTFVATNGEGGPEVREPLVWTVAPENNPSDETHAIPRLTLELDPGTYGATVLRPSDEAFAEARFEVRDGGPTRIVVALAERLPEASLALPDALEAGAKVPVAWEGPGEGGDRIEVRALDSDEMLTYAATAWGNPVDLALPAEAGTYDVVYVWAEGRQVLTRVSATLSEPAARLELPATAEAGMDLIVPWTGPDNGGDQIQVRRPGSSDKVTYAVTGWGNPAELSIPSEPGTYDVVYVLNQDQRVIARASLTVVEAVAMLEVPATLEAGGDPLIPWTGPDNGGDQIQVRRPGEDKVLGYAVTGWGNPSKLSLPPEAGEYEILYVLNQGRRVIAREPVTLTEPSASLPVPSPLTPGARVEIAWTGPGNGGDTIEILPEGSDRRVEYAATAWGNPSSIELPEAPGRYRLVYRLGNGKRVIAETPFVLQ
ncbi:MAG: VWA domain-containing protein [Pseudomonadota bacterium]